MFNDIMKVVKFGGLDSKDCPVLHSMFHNYCTCIVIQLR